MYLSHKNPEINFEYVPLNAKVQIHYIAWTGDSKKVIDSSLLKGESSTAHASGVPFEF
jgi:hypothetical protein